MNDNINECASQTHNRCDWCSGRLNACDCERQHILVPLLADLIRQVGPGYFSTEPLRLQKQVARLSHAVFEDKREACFAIMRKAGMNVKKLRQRGIKAVKE